MSMRVVCCGLMLFASGMVPSVLAAQHTWRSATEAELTQALPARAPVDRGVGPEQGELRQPALLVKCKAPEIKLTPAVLQQAQRYWQRIPARFIVITNGIEHACWATGPPPARWDRWPTWAEAVGEALPK